MTKPLLTTFVAGWLAACGSSDATPRPTPSVPAPSQTAATPTPSATTSASTTPSATAAPTSTTPPTPTSSATATATATGDAEPGDCAPGTCPPALGECFTFEDGYDTCAIYCASVAKECLQEGCNVTSSGLSSGFTWLSWNAEGGDICEAQGDPDQWSFDQCRTPIWLSPTKPLDDIVRCCCAG